MDKRAEAFIGKIDELLKLITPLKGTWWSSKLDGGFKDTVSFESIYTETISLIAAIYGKGSPHYQRVIHFYSEGHLHALEQTEGLLIGTKKNLESGLIDDLKSKVLIDIKTDFLETANNLLNEGEKDPAAVLSCIVLEDSLKRLAIKSNIEKAKNKELSVVAGLLFRAGIIEKSTNQLIQSFKNLRNAALHAQWEQISAESVDLLLKFLPLFFEKHGI